MISQITAPLYIFSKQQKTLRFETSRLKNKIENFTENNKVQKIKNHTLKMAVSRIVRV